MQLLKTQQGSALITALFVVSLVALMAVTLIEQLQRHIHRTTLLLQHLEAENAAEGALFWAVDSLNTPTLAKLPLHLPTRTLKNYTISSRVDDAQACFNINNLHNKTWLDDFKRLLLNLEPTLSSEAAEQLTTAVANRINDSTRPFTHLRELAAVKGITPGLYQKIHPFLTLLPGITSINVNTAEAPLLQSLSPALTAEDAAQLVALRQREAFTQIESFLNIAVLQRNPIAADKITTNSLYYQVTTHVESPDQTLVVHTLLQRNMQNGKPKIEVLWQTTGV